MDRTPPGRTRTIARHRASRFVALALVPFAATALRAAEPANGSGSPSGSYGPPTAPDAVTARRFDLSIGRSAFIELPRDAKEVFVANPAIANAVVRSARKLFLIGVSNGVTSVYAIDAEGRQIASFEINVGRDLGTLRQTLRTAIPTGKIEVRAAGDSILLTGSVIGATDAQQAVDIAKAFVGQTVSSTAGSSSAATGGNVSVQQTTTGSVINAITISGRDQVMIKVTVVEVARTALKQLGVNIGGNWNIVDTAASTAATVIAKANPASNLVGFASGAIGAVGSSGASISGQYGTGRQNIGGTLTALEQAGVSRTLAEPTLVAVSGESASFLAGGEVPIVITASCPTGQFCPPTVSYKAYGVSLAFTPVVMSEGRISLRVATEVNEIDRDTQDPVTKTPGFRTRKTATTVELPSGASMVTAGLISSQSNQSISGVPGLINLPVLGALFRSRDFQRRDSELMILVTPYLAKPMETAQAVRPDDGLQDPSDPQALLLGRLNRLYGTAGPGGATAGRRAPSGRFGFITD